MAPVDKAAARDALRNWLSADHPVLVRINAPGSDGFDDDVAVCASDGVAGIVLPKAEHAEDVARIRGVSIERPVFPLIETARGLWNALAIAQAPHVGALMFGSLDYQADLGITDDDLLHARSQLVLVSRVAGIDAPVDGVTQSIDDHELLRRDCHRARQLGFAAKLCIHPSQVDVVNRCLGPDEDDLTWARRVVAAFASSSGNAALLDGKMIDRPVLLKAQAMLAEAAGARDAR